MQTPENESLNKTFTIDDLERNSIFLHYQLNISTPNNLFWIVVDSKKVKNVKGIDGYTFPWRMFEASDKYVDAIKIPALLNNGSSFKIISEVATISTFSDFVRVDPSGILAIGKENQWQRFNLHHYRTDK